MYDSSMLHFSVTNFSSSELNAMVYYCLLLYYCHAYSKKLNAFYIKHFYIGLWSIREVTTSWLGKKKMHAKCENCHVFTEFQVLLLKYKSKIKYSDRASKLRKSVIPHLMYIVHQIISNQPHCWTETRFATI